MYHIKTGLQLFSIRDKMEKDMEAALKMVKEIGYDYVEFAGYFGKSAQEIKEMLDRCGLKCISVHQSYDVFLEKPEENIEYLKILGAKYCAIPWMDKKNHKGYENFEHAVGEIAKAAEMLRTNGIQMLYHNHEFELDTYQGKYLLEWLLESVPDHLLKPELDTCWLQYSGCDPCAYIEKWSGNVNILHFKDFATGVVSNGAEPSDKDNREKSPEELERIQRGFRFRPVGSGVQDWESILRSAENAGTEYIIVEQDESYDMDSMECAEKSRKYLRLLGCK